MMATPVQQGLHEAVARVVVVPLSFGDAVVCRRDGCIG